MNISDAHIQTALDKPELFYHNILANFDSNDNLLLIDMIPYTSVYFFLNEQEIDTVYLDEFIRRYTLELENECSNVSKDILEIKEMAKKNHFIRNLLYRKEFDILQGCDNCTKFENYLSKYGGLCEEFDLYANYKIACEKRMPFSYFNKIIVSYPNSDLFDIHDLKQKCNNINGFHILWSDNANEHQKAIVVEILNGMIPTSNGKYHYKKTPITKKQWCTICNVLNPNNFEALFSQDDTPMICNCGDCLQFIKSFQYITSIGVRLLNYEEIQKIQDNEVTNNEQIVYEWCREGKTDSPNVVIYNQSPSKVKLLDYLSFATFRLTI